MICELIEIVLFGIGDFGGVVLADGRPVAASEAVRARALADEACAVFAPIACRVVPSLDLAVAAPADESADEENA